MTCVVPEKFAPIGFLGTNADIDIDDNAVLTPEHINKYLEVHKRTLKRECILMNKEKLKYKNDLSLKLPVHCNQLFNTSHYKLLTTDRYKSHLMREDITLNLSDAKQLVKDVSPALVESVLLFREHWFLISSFSIFLHEKQCR